MANRAMATVGFVSNIEAIPGADRIVRVDVLCGSAGKWSAVVPVDTKVQDRLLVFMPDAMVPHSFPELAFMEKYKWIVRPARFKGVASEVVAIPIPDRFPGGEGWKIGEDLSLLLGVEKFTKPIPAGGMVSGPWPSRIPKTDEPNFQSVPHLVEALVGREYYSTIKVDGSSCTAYRLGDHFGVCSRNWELSEDPPNAYWRAAGFLKDTLPDGYAVQMEVVGPGIQKNPLKLDKVMGLAFNVYDIGSGEYLSRLAFLNFCDHYGIVTVRLHYMGIFPEMTDEELRLMAQIEADGAYSGNVLPVEGLVFRPIDECRVNSERLSFKVINLLYKG